MKNGKNKIWKLWIMFLLCLALGSVSVNADESAVNKARNGVVRVIALYEQNGEIFSFATGSGFGVGKAGKPTDTFVTNWHVVTDENGNVLPVYIILDDDAIKADFVEFIDENGVWQKSFVNLELDYDKLVPCTIVDIANQYPDVAIIKADHTIEERMALPLLHAEDAKEAQKVYALGFPGDADHYSDDIYETDGETYIAYTQNTYGSVESVISTDGTISRFTIYTGANGNKVIQSTAEINHGNSGGPLITENGAVIGINTYGVGTSSYSTSIYVDYAMDMLDANGISYDLYKESFQFPDWVLPIAVVVLAVAVIGILFVRRQKQLGEEQKREIERLESELDRKLKEWQESTKNKDSGYRLNGIAGVFSKRRFAIGDTVMIGRGNGCQLRYPADTKGVSNSHCKLVVIDGKLFVVDSGSTYGTFLSRGERIPKGAYIQLPVGEKIYFGSKEQGFEISK